MGNTGSKETKFFFKITVLRGCAAARMAAQPKNKISLLKAHKSKDYI